MVKKKPRDRILDTLRERILILDGAMGSLLQRRGLPEGCPPDLWNLENPEAVAGAHREYARAGAEVLLTNTFGASRTRLAGHGAAGLVDRVNKAGVDLARRAAGTRAWVAGDLGPCRTTGPVGEIPFEKVRETFREQAGVLVSAGVDMLVVETMLVLSEMEAAVLACNDVRGDIPLMASMTFPEEGGVFTGTDPAAAATALEEMGVDIVGVNCATGPEPIASIVSEMARVTRLPIAAQPSAGLPVDRYPLVYPTSAARLAGTVPRLREAGASAVGGCCGTTPEFIELAARRLAGQRPLGRAFARVTGTVND